MVEISMFGSGEGLVWVTGRGYSTTLDLARRWRVVSGVQIPLGTPRLSTDGNVIGYASQCMQMRLGSSPSAGPFLLA